MRVVKYASEMGGLIRILRYFFCNVYTSFFIAVKCDKPNFGVAIKWIYFGVVWLSGDISVAQMGDINTIRTSIAGASLITVRQVLKRSSWVNINNK